MRDISSKVNSLRTAVARARLKMSPETLERIRRGDVPKGDPLDVAKIAAIQAAKSTAQLIPYCHPVPVEHVSVVFEKQADAIVVDVLVKAIYKTGVEMEAMTAASVAALTLYDMLKMLDDTMAIENIELLSKQGGKSDHPAILDETMKIAVLVISDSVAAGSRSDESGTKIASELESLGATISNLDVVPDDEEAIEKQLLHYADELKMDLVITTGGTGAGPRDRTPEVVSRVCARDIPGIAETMRAYGQERTPFSMLSRSCAGVRGQTLIICLPGSPSAVTDSLQVLRPVIQHLHKIMHGAGHGAVGENILKINN